MDWMAYQASMEEMDKRGLPVILDLMVPKGYQDLLGIAERVYRDTRVHQVNTEIYESILFQLLWEVSSRY